MSPGLPPGPPRVRWRRLWGAAAAEGFFVACLTGVLLGCVLCGVMGALEEDAPGLTPLPPVGAALAVAAGGIVAGWRGYRVARRSERQRLGLCPWCGYDVRAGRGRCPECGQAAPVRE